MPTVKAFEIDGLGVDHDQYFQGAGIAFTDWDYVAVGIGNNAKEAYEDAVELLSQTWDTDRLPTRPRGIRKSDSMTQEQIESDGLHYYVAIRVR